jgi:hypothetical protein
MIVADDGLHGASALVLEYCISAMHYGGSRVHPFKDCIFTKFKANLLMGAALLLMHWMTYECTCYHTICISYNKECVVRSHSYRDPAFGCTSSNKRYCLGMDYLIKHSSFTIDR